MSDERDPFSGGFIDPTVDQCTKYAIDLMVGRTNHVVDNKRNALILRGLTGPERDYALRLIKAGRRNWLTRNIMSQRHWQAATSRRPGRARHHDSWSIRDLYVRYCGDEYAQRHGGR